MPVFEHTFDDCEVGTLKHMFAISQGDILLNLYVAFVAVSALSIQKKENSVHIIPYTNVFPVV